MLFVYYGYSVGMLFPAIEPRRTKTNVSIARLLFDKSLNKHCYFEKCGHFKIVPRHLVCHLQILHFHWLLLRLGVRLPGQS